MKNSRAPQPLSEGSVPCSIQLASCACHTCAAKRGGTVRRRQRNSQGAVWRACGIQLASFARHVQRRAPESRRSRRNSHGTVQSTHAASTAGRIASSPCLRGRQ
eukprot:93237-Prorocentrum_minimum.AAC.1